MGTLSRPQGGSRVSPGVFLRGCDRCRQKLQTQIASLAAEWLDSVHCAITRQRRSEANLLTRRMAALGLDACELHLLDPLLALQMQRECTRCDSRAYCRQDLDGQRSNPGASKDDWRDYCPNAMVLEMLAALKSRSH